MADQGILAVNKNGLTALDMAENSMPRDLEGVEVANALINAGVPRSARAKDHKTNNNNNNYVVPRGDGGRLKMSTLIRTRVKEFMRASFINHDESWLKDMRGWLMTLATLAATMAFQSAMQPPGGVWAQNTLREHEHWCLQNDGPCNWVHMAGSAVAAGDTDFFLYNTCVFVTSLGVILILVSGAPLNSRVWVWTLMIFIWGILTFMTLTYSEAMLVINAPEFVPDETHPVNGSDFRSPRGLLTPAGLLNYSTPITIWRCAMAVVVVYQVVIVLIWLARMLYKFIVYLRKPVGATTT